MPIELTNRRPTTFEAMLDSWADAKSWNRLAIGLPVDTVQRFVDRRPTGEDLVLARCAVMYCRGPILAPFLPRPTQWFNATINVDGLPEVSTVAFFRNDGYLTLADLVDRHPDMTIQGFDPANARGRPILVSVDGNAPWYLIEGGHRCCEIIRRRRAGNFGATLPVIIGVCPRAREMPHIG